MKMEIKNIEQMNAIATQALLDCGDYSQEEVEEWKKLNQIVVFREA